MLSAIQRAVLAAAACLMLLPVLTPVQAQPAAPSAGDNVLLDMRQAFEAGNSQRLAQLLPQAAGHPLEPLAAYWELNTRLRSASSSEIRAFLRRWEGSFYEDRLRNDWLLELGRSRDWPTFVEQLPLLRSRTDREVTCYALVADTSRPVADRARQLPELWLAQTRADQGCALAAAHFLASGHLAPDVVWQRARLAMQRNQVAIVAQALGLIDPALSATASDLHSNPERRLSASPSGQRSHANELDTLALIRLATRDPQAGITEAARAHWRNQLSPEQHSWVWGVIGWRMTQRLSPDALGHFANAQMAHLSDEHLIWRTRAALRAGAWDEVRRSIMAMSDAQRTDVTWSYWLARALMAQNTPASRAQAQGLYERIAGIGGFYEQLALEALGRAVVTPPAPQPLTPAEVAAARSHPGLMRSLHAIQIGLRTEGVREWHHAIALNVPGGKSERELLAAADLACSRQVWDRCINTSKRTRHEVDQRQRFPMPFEQEVISRSREIGLDPAYVFGLIRQESRFIMDARSHVGAQGLMQIMPDTAKWTARRIGLHDFRPEHINDRDTNIQIGTAYLRIALDNFGGSAPLAAAAYNAGGSRARNWRNGPTLEAAIWIENIPFEETRDYVKRVLANATNYAALITGEPQRLSSRLQAIGPAVATAQAPHTDTR
jgi:soluble lytic murein transglycosylase